MEWFINWCTQERKKLQARVDLIQSGKMKFADNDGSGWVDRTEEIRIDLLAKIAELDGLLAEAHKRSSGITSPSETPPA